MRRIKIHHLCSVLLLLLLGCEGTEEDPTYDDPGTGDSDADTDGDTDSDSDSDADGDGDGDSDADGDGDADGDADVCDEQDFEVEAAPPRLMILQDLSGSMSEETPTKWNVAKQAVTTMLNNYASELEFGWDVFPNNQMCGVNQPVVVDSGPGTGQTIVQTMNTKVPNGATPLYVALRKFTDPAYAPEFTSPNATPYLLVVSDGGDTCGVAGNPFGNPATPAQLGSITAQLCQAGVSTFAIGFGSGVDPAQLTAIAQNGCTGFNNYLIANNQQQLEEALDSLASSVVSCVYEIKELDDAVDPEMTNFAFDGVNVGYDEDCAQDKGWTWTDDTYSSVEFCKEACDELAAGEVEKISATFGCPSIPVQ